MNKLILHIPHSSNHIPSYDGFLVDKERIDQEILKLTDWYTDDLFASPDDITVKAEFSRVFCDVERFSDDEQEVMARYGMGVIYEKTDSGEPMRKVSADLRKHILGNYYWKHHNELSQAVNKQLLKDGKAVIVDCHSYSHTPFLRDLNQELNRPDFCIGTDSFHTPPYLIQASVDFFKKRGYTVEIDSPYSGTIVPLEHYGTNGNVQSLMLEINRNIYLDGLTNRKTKMYIGIKEIVKEYLKEIRSIYEANGLNQ